MNHHRIIYDHDCRQVETDTFSTVSSLVDTADDEAALQAQLSSNPEVDGTSAAALLILKLEGSKE